MKSIAELLDKQVADITRSTRQEREIQLTRAYLRYLELGHCADELCIYEWPTKVSVQQGHTHYSQKYFLGLKSEPPTFD